MKKMMLAAIGLTGLLASCNIVIGSDPVTITQLNSYTSSFYTERLENGQTVRDYIICNNYDTTLYMDTSWAGPLTRLSARLTYTPTGGVAKSKVISTSTFAADDSGRDTFTYTIGANTLGSLSLQGISVNKGGPGLAAQAVKAQGIVITPTDLGNVGVDLWGYNPDGLKSNELNAPQTIPVKNCVF